MSFDAEKVEVDGSEIENVWWNISFNNNNKMFLKNNSKNGEKIHSFYFTGKPEVQVGSREHISCELLTLAETWLLKSLTAKGSL